MDSHNKFFPIINRTKKYWKKFLQKLNKIIFKKIKINLGQ